MRTRACSPTPDHTFQFNHTFSSFTRRCFRELSTVGSSLLNTLEVELFPSLGSPLPKPYECRLFGLTVNMNTIRNNTRHDLSHFPGEHRSLTNAQRLTSDLILVFYLCFLMRMRIKTKIRKRRV